MSMSSYRRNARLGVTGPKTNTCFPAAFDKISPYYGIAAETYRGYKKFMRQYDLLEGQERRKINPTYKEFIDRFAWELGGYTYNDVIFERAETYREFSNTVRKLMRHEYRVAVDVLIDGYEDMLHPVGLIPLNDEKSYRAVSNWIPPCLYGAIALHEVWETTGIPNEPYRMRYPFNNSNITALPPAA